MPWCGRRKLYPSMKRASRRTQSSKSAKTVRLRNSSHSVRQKRSTFPSVCGWCGRLLMCWMFWRRSSASNSVCPRHVVYCRPLSVSTSRGAPKAATPRSKASITSADFCWCAMACPTMKRL